MAERSHPREYTPYRERAELTAIPAALFGGVVSYNNPQSPTWPVLYIETPEGQISWHNDPDDMGIFKHLPVVDDYPWDGHTTEEKYARIRRLVRKLPKMTYDKPMYGNP